MIFTIVESIKGEKCWRVEINANTDRWSSMILLDKHARREKIFQIVKYVKDRKDWMAEINAGIDLRSESIPRYELARMKLQSWIKKYGRSYYS